FATSAGLSGPSSVAFDRLGNIYIADTDNERVRRIAPNSTITTIAGNGQFPPKYNGDNILATQASLATPLAVQVGADGNLYIADSGNNRVRRVAADGTITTFAGNGQAGFGGDSGNATSASLNLPGGLAFDNSGNLYIADIGNGRIRKVTGGIITTIAGG